MSNLDPSTGRPYPELVAELTAEKDDLRRSLAETATAHRALREQKDAAVQDRANYEQAAREEKARADELARKLDHARARVREALNELGG
jgi:ABC-type transporter Mla subunit MlaD